MRREFSYLVYHCPFCGVFTTHIVAYASLPGVYAKYAENDPHVLTIGRSLDTQAPNLTLI